MNRNCIRFSKEFSDVAQVVIIDGEIAKNRNDLSMDEIKEEILNRNKVIVQTEGKMNCYFKKEDKKVLVDIISRLPNPMLAYGNITIIS